MSNYESDGDGNQGEIFGKENGPTCKDQIAEKGLPILIKCPPEILKHPSTLMLSDKNEVTPIEIPKEKGFVLFNYLKKKTGNLTRRQALILVLFAFVDLLAAAVVSIQSPFFPQVAADKGASATEYGLVFGIFEFTSIIASPILGAKMGILGPHKVFKAGILITGISSIVFGLLHKIEGRVSFITSCLLVRVCESIGESCYVTASFTIIAVEFPDAVAFTFGILETCYGLGMILGPLLGGVLYEIGGYSLPFAMTGGLLFTSALVTCIILPKKKKLPEIDAGKINNNEGDGSKLACRGGMSMFNLIKIPMVLITSYGIIATSTGIGFLCALLEPHLQQFELNKVSVGAVFVLCGGTYAFSTPLWGLVCDYLANPKLISMIGTVFALCGFIVIGPLPFFSTPTILWVTCVGLILVGLGMGAVYVAGFVIFLNDAIERGYPDNVTTYGQVSGLWTAMVSAGYFVGPTVGGLLQDYVGFRWGSLFVLGTQTSFILLLIAYFIKTKSKFSGQLPQQDSSP